MSKRLLWFVSIYAASVLATVAISYLLRMVLIPH